MGEVETHESLVESLFHGTGSSYDEMVNFATWGRDRKWKEELMGMIEGPERILDLASGTGILSLEMARRFSCHVTGVELREEYCQEARELADQQGISDIRFVISPAEHFLIDETFDYITSCYIPKYIRRLDKLCTNMSQMLRPGGKMLMQDFAYPSNPDYQVLYDNHFKRMQRLAREKAPDWATMFEKLPRVIRESTWIEDMCAEMKASGLVDVKVHEQSFGLSAVVSGSKPS